jgi:hypothetical protein
LFELLFLILSFLFNGSKLPIWSCISSKAFCSTPTKVVKYLLKVKFDGKSKISAYDHVLQFIQNFTNSSFYDIDEGILCMIFTLTLIGHAKDWCESLPVSSVDSWDQSHDFPSQLELIGWFRHILSLPCINHNEQKYYFS